MWEEIICKVTSASHGGDCFRNPRIVMYSHDTMGLGHIRRNLLIAQVLSRSHLQPDILLISGVQETSRFTLPPGVEHMILPSLYKEQDGGYRSRRLRMPLSEMISMRRDVLKASIRAFEPDVMIVDNVPWGAVNELDSTLEYLRTNGHTRCVLGLRSILDEPTAVKREWSQKKNEDVIRKYYDKIWIYGDAAFYDMVQEYNFAPEVAAKIHYTGFLDQRARLAFAPYSQEDLLSKLGLQSGSFVLCLVGSGQDGVHLAEAFAKAELPEGISGLLLAGPHMDPIVLERLHQYAATKPQLKILDFIPEPTMLLQHACCIIAMGGYNTVSEILSFGKQALIVPRVIPRQEQLIRAQRLHHMNILDMLHPDKLNPQVLTRWIKNNLMKSPRDIKKKIDMNGLVRIPQLLEKLLNKSPCSIQAQELICGGI